MDGESSGWHELSRTVRDEGMGIRIGEVVFAESRGPAHRRRYLHTPEVVAVVAMQAGMLHLIREFRAAVGQEVLQVPMGKVAPGRAPVDCAVAELARETGCRAEGWELKGSLLACPGWMDQVVHVFRATGLTPLADRYPGAGPFAAEDGLTVVPVPVVGFRSLVRAGTIRDARTIAAVLLAL
ncbi:MAG TPA: NUDIX hydrolase [Actinocrinis sp.]|nr:NUDIX hydrolase [Actinocrinis sp.]